MIPLTVAQIADAVGADVPSALDGSEQVTGVTHDSRAVSPGDVFVAIVGEQVDGHDYVTSALHAGAVVALVEHEIADDRIIVVSDALTAIGQLAHAALAAAPEVTTIAVTGSSGKTSTKDLLRAIFEANAPTIAPPGSFNNELGLPMTVCSIDDQTRWLVLEMGSRGKGHIATLCQIARPDIGMVINVGQAHAAEFGSPEATAQAKGELVESLSESGTAILNADDPLVAPMAQRTKAQVLTFGHSDDADVQISELTVDEHGRAHFTLRYRDQRTAVDLLVVGEHQAANAAAAAAAGLAAGLELDAIGAALSGATASSRWRMEVSTTDSGVTIVNDAYNANPESMAAGLRSAAAMAATGKRWAVIGAMAELGPVTTEAHEQAGKLAAELGYDAIVAVGSVGPDVVNGVALTSPGSNVGTVTPVADADAAIAVLTDQLQAGDLVFIKASRSTGLERVAQALLGEQVATS